MKPEQHFARALVEELQQVPVDTDARLEQLRRRRRTRRLARGALLGSIAAAASLVVLGFVGALPVTFPDGEDSGSAALGSGRGCRADHLGLFVDAMRHLGVSYEDPPSSSPADLASRADVAVNGNLLHTIEEATPTQPGARPRELILSVSRDEMLLGDPATVVETLEVAIPYDPSVQGFATISEAFERGARGVFFLVEEPSEPGRWRPLPDGIWLQCETMPPASLLVEPAWVVTTLHPLETEARKADSDRRGPR